MAKISDSSLKDRLRSIGRKITQRPPSSGETPTTLQQHPPSDMVDRETQTDIMLPARSHFTVTMTSVGAPKLQHSPSSSHRAERINMHSAPPAELSSLETVPESEASASAFSGALETYPESIQRALALVPVPTNASASAAHASEGHSLTIASGSDVQTILAQYFIDMPETDRVNLFSVSKEKLDNLWKNGLGHGQFDELVQALTRCEVPVEWRDESGRMRTIYDHLHRVTMKPIKDTDPGSAEDRLGPAVKRKGIGSKAYIKTNAATALALLCLTRGDVENFARVCAGDPGPLISGLLDEKSIGHGPIFTEPFIWHVIAHGAARVRAEVGSNRNRLESLTRAFSNFLAFHQQESLTSPYPSLTKWAYENGRLGTDSLANNPEEFAKCVESIWESLCPPNTSLGQILSTSDAQKELDKELGAITVNLVFSGIDNHLKAVSERKTNYTKFLDSMFSFAATVPVDATATGLGNLDAGLASSVVAKFCDLLLSGFTGKVEKIHVHSDPDEMRKIYASLYQAVSGTHSEAGRFVIGNPILNANEMRALIPAAHGGPVIAEELHSSIKSPTTIRHIWEEQYRGTLNSEDFTKIASARDKAGTELKDYFSTISDANTLTPEMS
jgi:hypothetical protein